MNLNRHMQVFLLLLTITGVTYAQEEAVDAINLPPCDQELVDVLKDEQDKDEEESTATKRKNENKIDLHDLTVQITNYKKDVNCTFEVYGNLYSPLLYAVCRENPAAVKALLLHEADPNYIQPGTNVTPMARLAWKSGGKEKEEPKVWEDHVQMATALLQEEAIWDYEFIMITDDVVDGKTVTIETVTSIETMSPNLIKFAKYRANHDMMGRTPKAKAKIKAQKEAAEKKLKRKRKKIKITF